MPIELGVHPVSVVRYAVEAVVSDAIDDLEAMVRWETLVELYECEHGPMEVAPSFHWTFS